MIKKYFRVKLLSDVVLNASLATEGNMVTLDYIPGSNFLGIVAQKYKSFGDRAYDTFHSGKVSFGDAHIAMGNAMSYRMPFTLFANKGARVPEDTIYVHSEPFIREMGKDKDKRSDDLRDLNPKQVRIGFFDSQGNYIAKPKQRFSLKSAQDPLTRRSKDEAMFGMESLEGGQEFIFYVIFEDDKCWADVSEVLNGTHFIGKSKSAQYGMVHIESIETPFVYESQQSQNGRAILYAESNLCFFNEWGQSTFRPAIQDLGLESGKINWELSQIRTYSYSPWNSKRNATSTQRDVILKGSVIVVDNAEFSDALPEQVGAYISEGLGRVIWNPEFLACSEHGKWNIKLKKWEVLKPEFEATETPLVKQLQSIKKEIDNKKKLMKAILDFLDKDAKSYKDITSSQWGQVRSRAQRASCWEDLFKSLFDTQDGFLMKGVGAVKMWSKRNLNGKLKKHLEGVKNEFGTEYLVKLAAEMAKWKQRHDKNEN